MKQLILAFITIMLAAGCAKTNTSINPQVQTQDDLNTEKSNLQLLPLSPLAIKMLDLEKRDLRLIGQIFKMSSGLIIDKEAQLIIPGSIYPLTEENSFISSANGKILSTSKYQEVGLLLLNIYDDRGKISHYLNVCTGTLIGEKYFLTAGHCVTPQAFTNVEDPRHPCSKTPIHKPKNWSVYFEGAGVLPIDEQHEISFHKDFIPHSDLNKNFTEEKCSKPRLIKESKAAKGIAPADFAILTLQSSPSTVPYAQINNLESYPNINIYNGRKSNIIGYGITDDSDSVGIKRYIAPVFDQSCSYSMYCDGSKESKIRKTETGFVCPRICNVISDETYNKIGCKNSLCFTINEKNNVAVQDTCAGDSGGPVFMEVKDNTGKISKLLVGTTVTGTVGGCIGFRRHRSSFVNISKYAKFIENIASPTPTKIEPPITWHQHVLNGLIFLNEKTIEKKPGSLVYDYKIVKSTNKLIVALNSEVTRIPEFTLDPLLTKLSPQRPKITPNPKGDAKLKLQIFINGQKAPCQQPTGSVQSCSVNNLNANDIVNIKISLLDITCPPDKWMKSCIDSDLIIIPETMIRTRVTATFL